MILIHYDLFYHIFVKETIALSKKRCGKKKETLFCVPLAALSGFEPEDAGIRIRCLTVWR